MLGARSLSYWMTTEVPFFIFLNWNIPYIKKVKLDGLLQSEHIGHHSYLILLMPGREGVSGTLSPSRVAACAPGLAVWYGKC